MSEQKQLEQFEIFYTIQGIDFIFNGSQKVKSDYDEEKLTDAFRQHLTKRFPLKSIKITAIKQPSVSIESL